MRKVHWLAMGVRRNVQEDQLRSITYEESRPHMLSGKGHPHWVSKLNSIGGQTWCIPKEASALGTGLQLLQYQAPMQSLSYLLRSSIHTGKMKESVIRTEESTRVNRGW